MIDNRYLTNSRKCGCKELHIHPRLNGTIKEKERDSPNFGITKHFE